MDKYICVLCGVEGDSNQMYEYRGVVSCSNCIDEVRVKRDYQRKTVMETMSHSAVSQVNGEWLNGGYKYMKTDSSGNPIAKIKEPLSVKDYEDGKL